MSTSLLTIKNLNDLSELCFKHSKFLKNQLANPKLSHNARKTVSAEYLHTRELKTQVRKQISISLQEVTKLLEDMK